MMNVLVMTQIRENYGAHDWDGTGECPQMWKCKGGEDITTNVVPSCRRCNQAKGSNNWLDWMRSTFGITDREHTILSHIN